MSERTEIEVVIPVDRPPTRREHRDLVALGFDECRRLIRSVGGGVLLGLASVARGQSLTGELALKLRFAVLVPEKVTERAKVITVDRKPGEKAAS